MELPTDRSRPLVRSGLGGSVSFVVPSSVVESLKRLAQQRNASLFMVGLAAFEVLLARWSGQVDIAVGTPIAGRTQAELEDVVGFFVNTLVVRGDLESNPSFEDFVDQIRDAALGAYDHQDLPFDRVVEELSPERDLSRTPVFQHMFALNVGSEGDDLELEHATVGLMSAEAKSSKFDLTLTLTQVADVLEGKVVFASDLFDTQTMERLAGHFVNLLTEAGSNPKQRVGDIDFLTERERLQLTVGFNDTASKFDDQALVHEFVERHARKTPDAVALWFEDESMTYGQLNSRANQLAVFLRRSGVESESLVAVCLERGFDMVVSLLAIWKAGGAYVPIDPAYPAERVAFMIEDTAAQVVLTQSSLVGLFSGARTNSIVALDVVALDLEELPTRDLDRRGSPTDLAYVIYTSGSTGTPKGVMIEHQGICSLVASDSSVAGIQSSDVILAGANFAFDAIVFELWAPLVSGAQSVIVDSTVMLNHGELESLILRRGVSVAFITTALLAQLVQMRSTAFSTLRCLLYGGERSDGSLVLGLREIDDGPKELRHVYGPTETTVFATQYLVPVQHGAVVPIGRPVANARAVVVDRWGGLAPVGVAGELLIGGAGVGRGYLNRPDLTAERFVDDPVVRGAGRVYRTGDLVRWLPGGSLEFLGRQDNQVKIRGLRIELGEIESQLMKSPTVSAGAVVVKDDGAGGKRLVAYCVSSSESVSELRDWCAQKLPAFMVPNVFVFLDALPMTPSGKLDRRALPEPVASRDSLEGEYVAPRNEVERALAEIWAEVLGVDRVGVHDNFFAIGGHSLLATKAVSRANQLLDMSASVKNLFVTPTIAGYAHGTLSGGVGGVPIARSERVEGALSFAQKRLWFLDQLTPESAEYVVPFGYQISGPVNLSALTKAFRKVVERHPVLRTACEIDAQGEPVQRVLEPWSVTIDEFDLTQVAVTDRDDRVREVVEDAFGMPFDLTAGQLLRVQWIHVGVEEGYLLFQIHHIAVDGWSAGIILADIEALYRGEITGNDVALSSAPVDYLDFAAWQQDLLSGELLERQLRFWCSALEGLEPVELPTDRSRPLVRSGLGGSVSFVVPSSVVESLKRLAQQRNASLFMVGLAAFEVLLARWSGQVDIAVGTPIAGRTQAELEDVVGFFVNTLVVRGDLESNPSFEDFVDQIRDAALGAYDHQDLPFDRVVEELSPERDLSRTPVFQHMFALNVGSEGDDLELEHATVGLMSAEAKSSKFDLTLTLTQVADVLEGKVVFASDLFDTQTMERLAGHFVNLLTEAGSNPKQRVGDIDFLTERERLQLTVGFNDTASKFDDQALVHEFVERHARKTPDAVALWFEDESMTYGQLNSRANQLAVFLRRSGVESESLVAVCLERGFDMVVSLLAIWKAGGAYVPIDPAYPAERVAFMIEDTAAQVVLTQSSLVGLFSGARTNSIVALDVVALDLEELPTRDLDRRGSPTDLAYVIYTSGSTGTPKGVMIEHHSLTHYIAYLSRTHDLDRGSWTSLVTASLAYDAYLRELLAVLVNGSCGILTPTTLGFSPSELLRLVELHGVSKVLSITPSVLREILSLDIHNRWPMTLTFMTGESGSILGSLGGLEGPVFSSIVHNYGPTECTMTSVANPIWDASSADNIGRPVANARAVVVDRWGGLAPVGVAGELLIGGAGVGRGYLNRPDLTAERFVDDPVVRGAGRVYRTGDLVRWLPGGSLEFLGRQDNQVKIRGLRIELGEIESQLMKSPTVSAGAVVVKDDGAGGKRLVAYCVSSSESVSELRDWCAQKLPAFMVPNVFVFLDALPMTPSGKLDRRALPEPVASRDSLEGEYVAPRNEVERALAEIWAEVLGVDRVGVHDNFFAIGGHSLLATKAVSRANQLLDMSASVKNLFVTPTIAGYAHGTLSGGVGGVPIARSERVEGALSFAQKRLWFLDQLTPESAEYVVPFGYQISGPVNLSALTKAFRKVVERHPVLRTACEIDAQGEPVQRVLEPWSVTIDEFDLTQVAVTDRDDRVREVVEDAFGMPFDLTAGQLLRVQWIHVGVEEGYLLFQIHHIAVDGWSAGIILADIEALYRGEITGNDVALSSAPVDYLDFAAWQQDLLSGELLERQLRFWCSALEGLEPVELPTDRSRPLVRSGLGGSVSFVVPSSVVESLKRLAQQRNASLFMVGLAAFEVLLARWSGQVDIAVGTPIAGRTQAELEDVVGFFVNTLVVRGDLESNPSFEDFVDQIRDAALGAYDHQDLPFDRVVEELSPERDLSRTPVFQHMFELREEFSTPTTLLLFNAVASSADYLAHAPSKLDISCTIEAVAGVLEGKVVFASDLFDTQTMERLAGHFVNLLTEAGSNPKQRVGDIDFLTERERLQLTVGFNDTASKFDDQALVHEFVERHARKTPDAVALWFEDESMTYGQLNSRANQLAVFLRRSGVESESLVAVCLERGFDMVVSLLAIWKAGGAYVPIDPAYPAERVAFMIEDTAAQVVLTQSSLVGLFSGARTNSIVALDVVALDLEELPTRDLDRRGSPTDLAYVIYTSGSTGTPKGVMIEHHSLTASITDMRARYRVQPQDVVAQFASSVFDASLEQLFTALASQAQSVLVGLNERDPHLLVQLLIRRQVTVLELTPAVWDIGFADGAFIQSAELRLRLLITGGDVLSSATLAKMLEYNGARVANTYGPTETTISATHCELWSVPSSVPIGRPVANARAVVVDRWGGLAPVGVAGELLIGGAGVGRGYLNRPDLTAERFVDDPVVRGAGRVYRTGDLVRWLPGGSLEFLGRQDNQVKIRGLRIELGEIESQLMKSPTVSAGAVVVKDDGAGGKRLVAYCVSSSESVSELRDWCAQKLPAFMVPNVFVFLDALPMTPSGKLDRRALPEPVASRDSLEGEYVAPRNEVERALAEIWAEVLGVDRVGVHDNFFAIGGHSLLVTKITSKVREALNISMVVSDAFLAPTVSRYSAVVIERYTENTNKGKN
ncbi:hypothetical protein NYA9BBAC_02594 [Salinibacterium sp. NYA9b]